MSSRTYALLLSLGLAGYACQAKIEGGAAPGGGDALTPTAAGTGGSAPPGLMAPPLQALSNSAGTAAKASVARVFFIVIVSSY